MLLSGNTSPFRFLKDNYKIISLLKEVGFEAYDFSMFRVDKLSYLGDDDYIEKAKALRKYADSIGIVCNQAHAPFPIYLENKEEQKERFKIVTRAIEIASILGAKLIVCHPKNTYTPEQNKEVFSLYQDVAKRCHIKIALENMWNWDKEKDKAVFASCSSVEDFKKCLSLLDRRYFTCLLDIGHAEMMDFTNAVEMIEGLGSEIEGVHIHDNDKHLDNHAFPFTMNIDFKPIMKALRKVGYKGDLTSEIEVGLKEEEINEENVKNLAISYYNAMSKLKKMFLED